MAFSDYNEPIFGGVIISTSIILHTIFANRTISMSRALYTLTGKEMTHSVSRYPLLLGLLCASSYLSLTQSSLFTGSDFGGLSIWGLIISGLLIGIGTAYATVGIEDVVYNHLPQFHQSTLIQFILMLMSGVFATIIAKSQPSFMNWFFRGSNDLGISINQYDGTKFVSLASGGIFLLFILYHKFNQRATNDSILRMFVSFICGGLYALGTIYSGLANKSDVQQFLNWGHGWQFGVGISILTVVIINIIGFYFINENMSPAWDEVPQQTNRMMLGSILFGLGLGFCGLAIGPILIQAARCVPQALLVLLPSMLVGYQSEYIIDKIGVTEKRRLVQDKKL